MNKKTGYLFIIILGLIPLLIWLGIEPIGSRFSNFTGAMINLGRISTLVGTSFFALAFLLNTRLKFLENLFSGLDEVYKAHHIFGTSAFILLLFHPVFLSVQYLAISANSAAMFFIPSFEKTAISSGIIALSIMAVLLLITFFVKLKYHVWKFSHKFLGLAFLFAIIHVLLISSDITRSNLLEGYMIIMLLIGSFSFLYKTLLYDLLKKKKRFSVEKVMKLNDNVVEVVLKPETKIKKYKAGQFIFVGFEQKELREEHPFTISSAPSENNLRLTIKESGDWTKKLKDIKVGTNVFVDGPYGNFYAKNNLDQIWIAGGIGITPFLSMARDLKTQSKVDLFYSVRETKDAVFIDELNKISDKNLRVHIFYTLHGKKLDIEDILKNTEIKNKEIFICGPKKMMFNLKKQFLSKGVDKKKIHAEEFGLL